MARAITLTGGRVATDAVIPGDVCLSVGMPKMTAPDGWSWRPLSELARLESGHTPSRKHSEYWGGAVPWIGIRDATGNHGRVIYETNENTNELGIANSSARLLPTNTVCLSRTASVGYVVVMGRPMATSQDFVNWVCGTDLNHHFLKYALLAETRALQMFAVGSVHPTIYFPEVKAFHICLPRRDEQDKISSVLYAFDEKIELNRRMNETLDTTARAIFKDWFVDFGPTRAKMEGRAPYMASENWTLFPDRLDHEGRPEGWTIRPLDKIAEFLNGMALQKYPAGDGAFLPVIKIAQLRTGDCRSADRASIDIPPSYIVDDGDILFSWSGSLLHRVWTGGRGALNQHLFKVTPVEFEKWFVFYWIGHYMEQFRAIAASKATTMGHIQRHHLAEANTIIPSDAVLKAANTIIGPIFEKMVASQLESRTLTAARDVLLPEIMSGKIRMRDAETALGVAP